MTVVCGGGCGITAIGRCHRCGEAFCASHQAVGRVQIVNLCNRCGMSEAAENRAAWEKERRAYEAAQPDFQNALDRLAAAGYPGAQPLILLEMGGSGIGPWRRRLREIPTGKRGWVVGTHRWGLHSRGESAGDVFAVTGVTTDGQLWRRSPIDDTNSTWLPEGIYGTFGGGSSVMNGWGRRERALQEVTQELLRLLN